MIFNIFKKNKQLFSPEINMNHLNYKKEMIQITFR